MVPLHKITEMILAVTNTIHREFPELYDHLNETPLFLTYDHMRIGIADYQQYLESIQVQLEVFKKLK
jgi:hypothetical protein